MKISVKPISCRAGVPSRQATPLQTWRARRPALLIIGLLLIIACAGHYRFPLDTMRMAPGGLTAEQTPQFVVFGNDDIAYSGLEASGGGGGIHYLTELFAARRNPAGTGSVSTFDGQPLHYSFYVNTKYITPEGKEDPAYVKQAWKEAIDHGHEIGVHTHSHPHGREFSVDQWQREMRSASWFSNSIH
jgi:hypothetical protein